MFASDNDQPLLFETGHDRSTWAMVVDDVQNVPAYQGQIHPPFEDGLRREDWVTVMVPIDSNGEGMPFYTFKLDGARKALRRATKLCTK